MLNKARRQEKVHQVMHEFKHHELRSGSKEEGPVVKSRPQAIAIAMRESGQPRRGK